MSRHEPNLDPHDTDDWAKSEPLHLRLNPCDIARFPVLAPLGDALALLAPECKCCAGTRVLIALLVGLGLGSWLL